MKIRSIDELENVISKEFAWRRKELSNIRNLSLSARKQTQLILLKSGVGLLYSHWEGFVKKSSIAYCDYINFQGLKYKQLKKNFHVCALLDVFEGQYPHRNFKSTLSVVDGSALQLEKTCKINSQKYIDTESNLNSSILKEITLKVGIDYDYYELKENLIDESFLGLRNAISHGEYRDIDEKDFIQLFEEVTGLIEIFKTQILNSAIQKSYLNKISI
ncbi:MAE_28990/MAE_18760 family HEPN-like nuclease [Nitrosomonas ureae]|uniref:RiboL-PSP-HEPN domain-containing protein n=1 Tax=Nitrosomonas ureae TaxID=44577 RepID=A0A1H2HGZ3_9PROT|nr:MAE_28990/MAE_18760 family HEPN-like nuclease [Nitrosomonas ureae]ALQ51647.1 hypothetical protein ATY38_10705 [Nitrosomonas ureae]SDU31076.1 hypothetical protein SAMN05216406_14910 [Nitrosomonas ureae]